jgi:outer membrane protein assembly factor BamB
MSDFKRVMAALSALAVLPLAACSSVPNPIDSIPFLNNDEDDGLDGDAPAHEDRISILELEQGLNAGEAAGPITLPTAYVNTIWPQPDGYATHAVQHTQARGSLDVAWRENFGDGSDNNRRLNARPVIADGKVFAMDAGGQISAMDADTGARVWRTGLRNDNRRDQISFGGGLAFDSGRIYAHSGYNFFVALDAETGAEIWRSETLVPFHGAPTVADGRIFVASDDNEMLALDARTGDVLWAYQGIVETARLLTAPSPAVQGDVVIAPFASGELVALRVQNGNPIWSDSLTSSSGLTAMSEIADVAGSPIILDGHVYAMSHAGQMVAIDLRSGERIWSQSAGSVYAPWVAGDYLFIATMDAEVAALNRNTGEIQWLTQLPLFENMRSRKDRIAWAGPIMAGGRLFLAATDGSAVIIDATDGAILREFDLDDDVYVAPTIANETIYVVTDEARLIALR